MLDYSSNSYNAPSPTAYDKKVIGVFNTGGNHWISYALFKTDSAVKCYYKDSFNIDRPDLDKAISSAFAGASTTRLAEGIKEQVDGSSCGIFALKNAMIFAQVSVDAISDDRIIFYEGVDVANLRKEFGIYYVASKFKAKVKDTINNQRIDLRYTELDLIKSVLLSAEREYLRKAEDYRNKTSKSWFGAGTKGGGYEYTISLYRELEIDSNEFTHWFRHHYLNDNIQIESIDNGDRFHLKFSYEDFDAGKLGDQWSQIKDAKEFNDRAQITISEDDIKIIINNLYVEIEPSQSDIDAFKNGLEVGCGLSAGAFGNSMPSIIDMQRLVQNFEFVSERITDNELKVAPNSSGKIVESEVQAVSPYNMDRTDNLFSDNAWEVKHLNAIESKASVRLISDIDTFKFVDNKEEDYKISNEDFITQITLLGQKQFMEAVKKEAPNRIAKLIKKTASIDSWDKWVGQVEMIWDGYDQEPVYKIFFKEKGQVRKKLIQGESNNKGDAGISKYGKILTSEKGSGFIEFTFKLPEHEVIGNLSTAKILQEILKNNPPRDLKELDELITALKNIGSLTLKINEYQGEIDCNHIASRERLIEEFALKNIDPKIVNILLLAGVDPNSKSTDGKKIIEKICNNLKLGVDSDSLWVVLHLFANAGVNLSVIQELAQRQEGYKVILEWVDQSVGGVRDNLQNLSKIVNRDIETRQEQMMVFLKKTIPADQFKNWESRLINDEIIDNAADRISKIGDSSKHDEYRKHLSNFCKLLQSSLDSNLIAIKAASSNLLGLEEEGNFVTMGLSTLTKAVPLVGEYLSMAVNHYQGGRIRKEQITRFIEKAMHITDNKHQDVIIRDYASRITDYCASEIIAGNEDSDYESAIIEGWQYWRDKYCKESNRELYKIREDNIPDHWNEIIKKYVLEFTFYLASRRLDLSKSESLGKDAASSVIPSWWGIDKIEIRNDAKSFDLETAKALGYFSDIVYKHNGNILYKADSWGYKEVKIIERKALKGVLLASDDHIVLLFRGTSKADNWCNNLYAMSQKSDAAMSSKDRPYNLHAGFLSAFRTLWQEGEQNLSQIFKYYIEQNKSSLPKIYITGHSLGGAMASICYLHVLQVLKDFGINEYDIGSNIKLYTYGQPRWCKTGSALSIENEYFAGNYYRIINKADIVPKLPPTRIGFKHIGVSFEVSGTSIFIGEGMPALRQRTEDNSTLPERIAGVFNAVNRLSVLTNSAAIDEFFTPLYKPTIEAHNIEAYAEDVGKFINYRKEKSKIYDYESDHHDALAYLLEYGKEIDNQDYSQEPASSRRSSVASTPGNQEGRLEDILQDAKLDSKEQAIVNSLLGVKVQTQKAELEALVGKLSDGEWQARKAAARAIGRVVEAVGKELGAGMLQKTLEALVGMLSAGKWYVRKAAAQAIVKVAAAGGKELGEGRLQKTLEALLGKVSDGYSDVREVAAWSIGKIVEAVGKDLGEGRLQKTLEALLGKVSDRHLSVRYAAAEAIGRVVEAGGKELGEKTLESLVGKLSDGDFYLRYAAAEAIGRVVEAGGKELGEKALEALVGKLSDRYLDVRKVAAQAIGKVAAAGGKDLGADMLEKALDALVGKLSDGDPHVRYAAAQAIGKVVEAVGKDLEAGMLQKALEALVGKFSDRDSDVRKAAAQAIGKVVEAGGKELGEKTLEALVGKLSDRDSDVRDAAAEAIGRVVEAGGKDLGAGMLQKTLEALVGKLSDRDSDVRKAAAEAIGRVVEAGGKDLGAGMLQKTLEALVGKLSDRDSDVRKAAAEAIGRVVEAGGKDLGAGMLQKTLESLVGKLSDGEWQVRDAAARAIGKVVEAVGKELGEKTLEALVGMLSAGEWQVRYAAAEAIGRVVEAGGKDLGAGMLQKTLEALMGKLSDGEWYIREAAAEAIVKVVEAGGKELGAGMLQKTLEALVSKLSDRYLDVRKAAAQAIGKIVEAGGKDLGAGMLHKALDALVGKLSDRYLDVRKAAAQAIGKIVEAGGKDLGAGMLHKALEALVGKLSDEDYDVRRVAAEAIENIAQVAIEMLAAGAIENLDILDSLLKLYPDDFVLLYYKVILTLNLNEELTHPISLVGEGIIAYYNGNYEDCLKIISNIKDNKILVLKALCNVHLNNMESPISILSGVDTIKSIVPKLHENFVEYIKSLALLNLNQNASAYQLLKHILEENQNFTSATFKIMELQIEHELYGSTKELASNYRNWSKLATKTELVHFQDLKETAEFRFFLAQSEGKIEKYDALKNALTDKISSLFYRRKFYSVKQELLHWNIEDAIEYLLIIVDQKAGYFKHSIKSLPSKLSYGYQMLDAEAAIPEAAIIYKILPSSWIRVRPEWRSYSARYADDNLTEDNTDHPLFNKINNLVQEIKNIKQSITIHHRTFSNIISLLDNLTEYYTNYMYEFVYQYGKYSDFRKLKSKVQYMQDIAYIAREEKPIFKEEQDVSNKLIYFLTEPVQTESRRSSYSGYLKDELVGMLTVSKPKDNTKYGKHAVVPYKGVHYKYKPYAPGIEFAINALNKILLEEICLPTRLIRLEGRDILSWKKVALYQASTTIEGHTLHDVLTNSKLIRKIDIKSFSALIISSLLTGAGDAKPDNFIVRLQKDQQKHITEVKLMGVDNDIAFAKGSLAYKAKKGRICSDMLNALFFFPQMDMLINSEIRGILSADGAAERIISGWLAALYEQNERYGNLGNIGFTKEDLQKLKLLPPGATLDKTPGIYLPTNTAKVMYERLKLICEVLKNNNVIHSKLFMLLLPGINYYYEGARVKADKFNGKNIIGSIKQLYADITEDENVIKQLYSDDKIESRAAWNTLSTTKMLNDEEFSKVYDSDIISLTEDFIASIDFAKCSVQACRYIGNQIRFINNYRLYNISEEQFNTLFTEGMYDSVQKISIPSSTKSIIFVDDGISRPDGISKMSKQNTENRIIEYISHCNILLQDEKLNQQQEDRPDIGSSSPKIASDISDSEVKNQKESLKSQFESFSIAGIDEISSFNNYLSEMPQGLLSKVLSDKDLMDSVVSLILNKQIFAETGATIAKYGGFDQDIAGDLLYRLAGHMKLERYNCLIIELVKNNPFILEHRVGRQTAGDLLQERDKYDLLANMINASANSIDQGAAHYRLLSKYEGDQDLIVIACQRYGFTATARELKNKKYNHEKTLNKKRLIDFIIEAVDEELFSVAWKGFISLENSDKDLTNLWELAKESKMVSALEAISSHKSFESSLHDDNKGHHILVQKAGGLSLIDARKLSALYHKLGWDISIAEAINGIEVNKFDEWGNSLLQRLILLNSDTAGDIGIENKYDEIEFLLKNCNANPNYTARYDGKTTLHLACSSGVANDTIELLLQSDASNWPDINGKEPQIPADLNIWLDFKGDYKVKLEGYKMSNQDGNLIIDLQKHGITNDAVISSIKLYQPYRLGKHPQACYLKAQALGKIGLALKEYAPNEDENLSALKNLFIEYALDHYSKSIEFASTEGNKGLEAKYITCKAKFFSQIGIPQEKIIVELSKIACIVRDHGSNSSEFNVAYNNVYDFLDSNNNSKILCQMRDSNLIDSKDADTLLDIHRRAGEVRNKEKSMLQRIVEGMIEDINNLKSKVYDNTDRTVENTKSIANNWDLIDSLTQILDILGHHEDNTVADQLG